MGNYAWRKEDVELLMANFNESTGEELQAMFPNRTLTAIYKKAWKSGLRVPKETEHRNRSIAATKRNAGKEHPTFITARGYVASYAPWHPRADRNGRVLEHILVWEEATNTQIPVGFVIHHINGNKTDNRIENLCLMTVSAHVKHHHTGKVVSEETRKLISRNAKERYSDKTKHPFYKSINLSEMAEMRNSGMKVSDICEYYGISKRTFYNKMEDYNAQHR